MYQRSGGTATVSVTGTYTGTVTNVEYRVDEGSWATLQSSPTGGTFAATATTRAGHGVTVPVAVAPCRSVAL